MNDGNWVRTASMETKDFEELQEAAEGWDQQYNQLGSGRFKGVLDMRISGSRQVMREYYGRKLQYRGTAPAGSFGLALPLDQPAHAKWVGGTVTNDTVVLQAPGREAHLVTADYWDALVLSASVEEVSRVTLALADDRGIDSGNHSSITLKPKDAANLRCEGRRFLKESAIITPENQEKMAKWCEQIVKLSIWSIVDAMNEEGHIFKSPRTAKLVEKATDIALSSPQRNVGLVEICESLDVSLRSLHYAFNDVTGMPPGSWLRILRLNRIHKSLRNAAPDDILVKQVAMDNGFFHLGHFSQQYREHFGCLPSETLKMSVIK